MASEYLKKKYADVKPDEPVPMTKKQKRANWWYYHKVPLLIGLAAVVLVGLFLSDILGQEEPDYQVAYISGLYLSEETTDELTALLNELGDDRNEDGEVVTFLSSYAVNDADPSSYLSSVALTADLTAGESQIFILENPAEFQEQFRILMTRDGNIPEEDGDPTDFLCYCWSDCPNLASVDLGDGYYLCRRFLQPGETDPAAGLWNSMTEGAAPMVWAE